MVRNRVNRVIESDRIRVMWRKIYVSERKEGRKEGRKSADSLRLGLGLWT